MSPAFVTVAVIAAFLIGMLVGGWSVAREYELPVDDGYEKGPLG